MPLSEDLTNLTVYPAGASAVVAALCDVLRIPEIIDATVTWDTAQCHLSPGLRVKAMLINILVHRTALWRVERFYEHQDVNVLFGPDQTVQPGDLNDDALARALDKLAVVDINFLYSAIALQAAMNHDVSPFPNSTVIQPPSRCRAPMKRRGISWLLSATAKTCGQI